MGWEDSGWKWPEVHAAAATAAAQVPVLGLIAWVGTFGDDDYGRGLGGGLAGAFFLLLLIVLPVLATLYAALFTMPVTVFARVAARRAGGPRWLWALLGVALLSVVWSAVFRAASLQVVLYVAGFALLPLLAVGHVRRRARAERRTWGLLGVWFRSACATVGLCVLVLVGAGVATAAGLIREYEPPVLSARQLTGVWRGDDGAALTLRPDGRAELTALPARSGGWDYDRCDGTGTWSLDREGREDPYAEDGPEERDGVVVRLDGECGRTTYWTIGGTVADPELFVLFGDPDGGELWILTGP
ncbi:hypothetical protein [Streptomyces sp. RG80]|uniref:hypothetical protein n=1 Tax=Streptomyces sp. RG80 TaxID=3157340 RepID=UPI00338EBDC5